MHTVDELISAKWVVPIIPKNTVLENYSIAVNDGKILDILPTKQALAKYTPKKHTPLNDHVLMPGLINAHTHTPMVLFRGLADDLPLMNWLAEYIWPAESAILSAKTVEIGSQLAMAEMIRSGTTCFNDMYFYPLSTATVALRTGMRASIGFHILNVSVQGLKNENDYLKAAVDYYNDRPKSDLLSWAIMPHATYTNTDASLRRAAELAHELELRIHSHAHETLNEIQMDMDKYGKRPLERLNEAGLLTDKTLLAHMVHLNRADIRCVKEKNVSVVSCPASNMKLGSGFPNIPEILNHDITVAIGTDGAATNDNLNMFEEVHLTALIAKGQYRDPTVLTAHQVLENATIQGAKALGLSDRIGSLEKGKEADIIAIDLNHYLTQPTYNPISLLVYAVNCMQVSDVWVQGRQLLKQTILQTIDIEQTVTEVQRLQDKVLSSSL
jgi:5-methylthioadenosine/S-adenosylhomocysteine deaminase